MTRPTADRADMSWPPPAFPPPPPAIVTGNGTRRHGSATYASTPGYRPRLLHVHVPASAGPVPLVVRVHGGGWVVGDRRYPPPTTPAGLLFGPVLDAGMAGPSPPSTTGTAAKRPSRHNEVADPGLGHDRDGDRRDDAVDHVRVGHPGHAAVLSGSRSCAPISPRSAVGPCTTPSTSPHAEASRPTVTAPSPVPVLRLHALPQGQLKRIGAFP